MLKTVAYLFWYELLIFFRRSQEWLYPLGFFGIVLCLFPLAITPDPILLKKLAAGAIWISAMLASLLALESVLHSDTEAGHIEQLLLNSHPLSMLMLVKIAAHWLVAELPLIILIPIMGWIFHLSLASSGVLMLTLLLGTPILSLIGTLGMTLTLGLRYQGALLGFLILPLMIPVLIFGVGTVQQYDAGFSIRGNLAFLSALFIFACCLIPWAIAVTLRLSMDD